MRILPMLPRRVVCFRHGVDGDGDNDIGGDLVVTALAAALTGTG
jgi:hypothetical protein